MRAQHRRAQRQQRSCSGRRPPKAWKSQTVEMLRRGSRTRGWGGHLQSEGLDPRHHRQPGARGAPRPVRPAAEDRQRASSISWALEMLSQPDPGKGAECTHDRAPREAGAAPAHQAHSWHPALCSLAGWEAEALRGDMSWSQTWC